MAMMFNALLDNARLKIQKVQQLVKPHGGQQ